MAYYVGTRQFPSVYAAVRYLAANPQPGVSITSAPVQTKPAPPTKSGMLTSPSVPPRQTPGDSGPFDPDGGPVGGPPKRTPAPAPDPSKGSTPTTTGAIPEQLNTMQSLMKCIGFETLLAVLVVELELRFKTTLRLYETI